MPTLITVKEAARILTLAEKTVHNRSGGTSKLTRVYIGTSVRLIKEEVEAMRQAAIDAATRRAERLK